VFSFQQPAEGLDELGGAMIEGTYNARDSKPDAAMNFLARRLRLQTKDTRVWIVMGGIILAVLVFWGAAMVYAYLADDVSATPADERSVPAPKAY
jgi:hypothetical protein